MVHRYKHVALRVEEPSDARALNAEGAAPAIVSSPNNIGKYSDASSSSRGVIGGAGTGDGVDGAGSSDVRSDDSSSSISSSSIISSSGSGSKGHGGAGELLVGVTSVALAAGGGGIRTETPIGQQHASAEAMSETPVSAKSRPDGQDALHADVQQACSNDGAGAAPSARPHATHVTSANDSSNAAEEGEARGAPASAPAPAPTSKSPDLESQAAGIGEDVALAKRGTGATGVTEVTGKGPLPGASSTSSLSAQHVKASDAWAGTTGLVPGTVAGGVSDNTPTPSRTSASSGLPAVSGEGEAENVEAMIEALPPGFVRCPGCPMVSRYGPL